VNINLLHPLGAILAQLPEIALTVFGLLGLLVAAWRHRTEEDSRLVGWVSLAGAGVALAALAWLWLNHARPMDQSWMVALDDFRFAADGLILISTIATILLSLAYVVREKMLAPEYYPLILFAAAGMLWLAGADDMMVLFLGLEVMSVAIYVLAGFNRASAASAESALKYFLLGAFASAFLLYGIALVYGATGVTSLSLAAAAIGRTGTLPLMAALGLGFFLVGFGFKVAAVPFHMWTPDVYEGAPTPVTGFMATGVKVAAFAALVRLLFGAFGAAEDTWRPILTGLGILSMLVGNLIALNQRSLKRMLAYSSIAHAGYLLVALLPGSPLAAGAALMYLAAYALTSLAAFGLLSVLGRDGERDVTLDSIAGLASQRPWLAAGLSVCMLSLLGFPGTVGFMGKWMILVTLLGSHLYLVAVVLVLASLVSAGYYLPVVMSVYMRPAASDTSFEGVTMARPATATVVVAVVLVVLLGLWPAPLLELAQTSSASFFDGLVNAAHHGPGPG
jgi:NADH-quinone oxidoreductase subunit N